MQYHTVIDRFPIVPPLDPLTFLCFAGIFVILTIWTARRPAIGAAVLAFVPPLAFAHSIAGTTATLPKIALLAVAAGLAGRVEAYTAIRARPIVATAVAFAVLTIATLATIVHAHYPHDVMRETFKWAEYTAYFCVAAVAYRLEPDASLVRRAVFGSIVLVCVSALLDEIIGAPFGMMINHTPIPRVSGLLGGPNQLGGYLEVAIAATAAWELRAPSRLGKAALVLAALTLPLTFSRAAFIGIVIIVLVLALADRHTLRRLATLAIGLGAGLAGAVEWTFFAHAPFAGLLLRASDVNPGATAGLGTRSELWRAAWYFFRHHPWLGIGAGNYEHELPQAGIFGVQTHANSWYFQALAEGGIALFAATLALLATALIQLRARVQASPWALAALAATLALAAHQVVDYLVFYPKVAEPWIALLSFGIASQPASPAHDPVL